MSVSVSGVGARLDRLPITGFHRQVLALIGGGMFFDAFDLYLAGGVLGALVRSGWSDVPLNAMFISVGFAGMLIGAWLAGVLGDRYGRRFTYQFNLAVFGLASLAGALAPTMGWLIAARFVMGIGLGAEIVVGYGTLAEFIPAAKRGRWGSILNLITNSALFFSTYLGFLIIPVAGWRWMFAIAGAGALLIWVLRKNMPESPRWLESVGRHAEASAIVDRIELQVVGAITPPHALPSQAGASQAGAITALEKPAGNSVLDLFAPALVKRTLVAMVVCAASITATYSYVSWIPTFLVKEGYSVASSLGFSTFMAAGGPAGALISIFIAENVGRRRGLMIAAAGVTVFGALYPFAPNVFLLCLTGFLLVTCLFMISALGMACYAPELFPTEMRLRGNGVANAFGRLLNIAVPYAVAALYVAFGIGGVVVFVSAVMVALFAVVLTFGPETRGRALEQIAPLPDRVLPTGNRQHATS